MHQSKIVHVSTQTPRILYTIYFQYKVAYGLSSSNTAALNPSLFPKKKERILNALTDCGPELSIHTWRSIKKW